MPLIRPYKAITYNHLFISESLATFSLVGETIHSKGYIGNSYGFKIPKDEVAHFLPLTAVADIAERLVWQSRDHEVNSEESENKK